MTRLQRLTTPTLLLVATLAIGCSGDGPETGPVAVYPVSGQILYDGKPAEGVRVMFLPMDAPSPPRIPQYANGVTDAEGRFTLSTYKTGDGAPEGGYQVVLDGSKRNNVDNVGSEASADTDIFKGWYDTMHSNLKTRVKAEANEIPVFKIAKITKEAALSEGIPGRN